MTKRREPLSVDAALARIAGRLPGGYARMAELTQRQARTVRNWGDPDTPEQIPLDCAIVLDLAYAADGGEGYPLNQAYSDQLELAQSQRFASNFDLLRSTAALIKEGGEAHAALTRACLPGATPADFRHAQQQLAEAFEETRKTLAVLTPVIEMHVRGANAQRAPP